MPLPRLPEREFLADLEASRPLQRLQQAAFLRLSSDTAMEGLNRGRGGAESRAERGWCGIAMSQDAGNRPAPGLQDRERCCRLGQGEHYWEKVSARTTCRHTLHTTHTHPYTRARAILLTVSLLKAPRKATVSPCECMCLNRLM